MADNQKLEFTEEQAKEFASHLLHSFASMCPHCIHNDVCMMKETAEMPCEAFVNSGDYKRYGNINDLFQPIFNWLQYHYPSGEVIFIVDNTSAKMHLEHGATACSKNLWGFANPTTKPDKPDEKSASD